MTDPICYLNLGFELTILYSRYFNIVMSFSEYFGRLERARIKIGFNNSVMRFYNPKFEVIALFPNDAYWQTKL